MRITNTSVKYPRVKHIYTVCVDFCAEEHAIYTTLAEAKREANRLARINTLGVCVHKGRWFAEYGRYDDVNLDDGTRIVEVYANRC